MTNKIGLKYALSEVIRKFGILSILRIMLYPVTVLFSTPVRLVQSLWNCRILLEGKDWSNYQHFNLRNTLVSLFYATRALNLIRYGRSGYSPHLGLGNYPLSRCFHYSLFSLYAYWKAGAVTLGMGMFGWWLVHFLWLQTENWTNIGIVLFLALFSTTFYANIFYRQNYNVLGWVFFPAALFGLLNEQWLVAAIAIFLSSFGSFTVTFLLNIIFIVVAIAGVHLSPIYSLIPANIKLLLHFYPFLSQSDRFSILNTVLNAIGIKEKKVKYKRSTSKQLNLYALYYLLLYIQFLMVHFLINDRLSVILLVSIILFIMNSTIIRFADHQSMHMLIFSIASAVLIHDFNYWLLPSYWFAVSPLPALAFSFRLEEFLDVVPTMKPYSLKKLKAKMEEFLSSVEPDKRILMAFDDPKDNYERIFDGYRILIELPLYIAAIRKIHLLPDWWAVFELNYEDAPDLWGRDFYSVSENIKRWKADYVMIYQQEGTQLEHIWQENGFQIVSKFSWSDYEKDFQESRPFRGNTPEWWLLKRPN